MALKIIYRFICNIVVITSYRLTALIRYTYKDTADYINNVRSVDGCWMDAYISSDECYTCLASSREVCLSWLLRLTASMSKPSIGMYS